MYKFYNANVLGNFVNDCTIRAISLAEGNTWDYTYDKLSDLAQAEGTMMDDKYFIRNYLDKHYDRVDVNGSVGQVAAEFSDKVCLITMPSHITCSIYGCVVDSFDCRRRPAEFLWVVKD